MVLLSSLFLIFQLCFVSVHGNTPIIIDSPISGSIFDEDDTILFRISVRGTPPRKLAISFDGIEIGHTSSNIFTHESKVDIGFHNVTARYMSDPVESLVVSQLLVQNLYSDDVVPLICSFLPIQTNDSISLDPGFNSMSWMNYKRCILQFLEWNPSNELAKFQHCKILETGGEWNEALNCSLVLAESTNSNLRAAVSRKISRLKAIIESSKNISTCKWLRAEDSCLNNNYSNLSCKPRENQREHGNAEVWDDREDLYISVIMVTRHDNTQFCQVPADSCLERLRASVSILVEQLGRVGLAGDAEVVVVEWNPCYLNTRRDEGTCDPRQGGYLSVDQAVRQLVQPAAGATLRVLLVTQAAHESLYNPLDLDLLEFVAKNVAARRARGRFLLFTNPDDCLSDAMVARLARRDLRHDVVYSTFRGEVDGAVPTGRGASAESMRRYVAARGRSSEGQPVSLAHQAGRWRRAACREGEAEEEPMRERSYGWFHDSAAGDFLLMAKRRFVAMRGYPEIPTNILIDGTALHAAVAHGMGQLVLAGDCVIFHQRHPRSYNTKGSMLSWPAYEALAQQLLDAGALANMAPEPPPHPSKRAWHRYNGPEWGLANESIPQIILGSWCH